MFKPYIIRIWKEMSEKKWIITASVLAMGGIFLFAALKKLEGETVQAEMAVVNEDGSLETVEPMEQEQWMVDKSLELQKILEEKNYVETAVVSISYSDSGYSDVKFSIMLAGVELQTHKEELLSLVMQSIENADLESSYMIDTMGNDIYSSED